MQIKFYKRFEKWKKKKAKAQDVQRYMDKKFSAIKKADSQVDFKKIGNINYPMKTTTGIGEIIIDKGPGYRIYFTIDKGVVEVIDGGDKDTQLSDIRRIQNMVEDYMNKIYQKYSLQELEELFTYDCTYDEWVEKQLKEDETYRQDVLEWIVEASQSEEEDEQQYAKTALERYLNYDPSLYKFLQNDYLMEDVQKIVEEVRAYEGFIIQD